MITGRIFYFLLLLVGSALAFAGETTLPDGRQITPAGAWISVAPYPFSIAVRPDGGRLAVPSVGFPFSLNILERRGARFELALQLPAGHENEAAVQVFTGAVYSADGAVLYDTTGDAGSVELRGTALGNKLGEIALDDRTHRGSFAAAAVLSADGRTLYVLDQANWRVAAIDTRSRRVVRSLPAGVNPLALALSPDGRRLYIDNSGLFEYRLIPGIRKTDILAGGLHFPPFGYPSQQAEKGTWAEGKRVPGLGSPNSDRGASLWTYDLETGLLESRLRLGEPIGEGKAVGGPAPSAVVAGPEHVYVALAHQDSIVVVSPDGRKLETEIPLSPFPFVDGGGKPLRGLMPSGLALGDHRLYVTEAGINALAVIDLPGNRVLGHIPVGWNPSAVALSPDGMQLFVVNSKGKGSGPNAGPRARPGPTYVGQIEYGSVSVLPVNTPPDTPAVVRNNEAALAAGSRLPRLDHVFLIIRENRTFDEILGDLPGADGAPVLARFGLHGSIADRRGMNAVAVTPNAHAIAEQFATSDAFFADSDVSADGHRWVVGIEPTPWLNLAWTSNYGGRRRADSWSLAPGRRALSGSADSPMPEDEPEYGSLWEHVASAHLSLLNYGEGLELEGSNEIAGAEPEGQRLVLNAPLPEPVWEATDRRYPTFNLGIPDQFRAGEFERDFTRRLRTGQLPALVVIRLPGDHTAAPRPADGYPAKASYVADNDLALGRIVDFLSHSAVWRSSAVFVTEDDAQDGVDHVDAHRSVLLVAGPYVKPGYIAHRHSDMGSIQKTIYELLGLGPLNLEDALASDLSDMFTSSPNAAPYSVRPSDARVFNPAKARPARPKTAAERAALRDCDDSRAIAREFPVRLPVASKAKAAR